MWLIASQKQSLFIDFVRKESKKIVLFLHHRLEKKFSFMIQEEDNKNPELKYGHQLHDQIHLLRVSKLFGTKNFKLE